MMMEITLDTTDLSVRCLELYGPVFQGEGSRVGEPSIFLRLSGCTVGCRYCDSKLTWSASGGKDWDVKTLIDHIGETYPIKTLVLTGGEVWEHPTTSIVALINGLLDRGFFVTVETSGTGHEGFNPAGLKGLIPSTPNLLWSIAPKLSSSRARKQHTDLTPWLTLGHSLQVKIVTGDIQTDHNEIVDYLNQFDLSGPQVMGVYLQTMTAYKPKAPVGDVRNQICNLTVDFQDWLTEVTSPLLQQPKFRVLPQVHAILYGAKTLI